MDLENNLPSAEAVMSPHGVEMGAVSVQACSPVSDPSMLKLDIVALDEVQHSAGLGCTDPMDIEESGASASAVVSEVKKKSYFWVYVVVGSLSTMVLAAMVWYFAFFTGASNGSSNGSSQPVSNVGFELSNVSPMVYSATTLMEMQDAGTVSSGSQNAPLLLMEPIYIRLDATHLVPGGGFDASSTETVNVTLTLEEFNSSSVNPYVSDQLDLITTTFTAPLEVDQASVAHFAMPMECACGVWRLYIPLSLAVGGEQFVNNTFVVNTFAGLHPDDAVLSSFRAIANQSVASQVGHLVNTTLAMMGANATSPGSTGGGDSVAFNVSAFMDLPAVEVLLSSLGAMPPGALAVLLADAFVRVQTYNTAALFNASTPAASGASRKLSHEDPLNDICDPNEQLRLSYRLQVGMRVAIMALDGAVAASRARVAAANPAAALASVISAITSLSVVVSRSAAIVAPEHCFLPLIEDTYPRPTIVPLLTPGNEWPAVQLQCGDNAALSLPIVYEQFNLNFNGPVRHYDLPHPIGRSVINAWQQLQRRLEGPSMPVVINAFFAATAVNLTNAVGARFQRGERRVEQLHEESIFSITGGLVCSNFGLSRPNQKLNIHCDCSNIAVPELYRTTPVPVELIVNYYPAPGFPFELRAVAASLPPQTVAPTEAPTVSPTVIPTANPTNEDDYYGDRYWDDDWGDDWYYGRFEPTLQPTMTPTAPSGAPSSRPSDSPTPGYTPYDIESKDGFIYVQGFETWSRDVMLWETQIDDRSVSSSFNYPTVRNYNGAVYVAGSYSIGGDSTETYLMKLNRFTGAKERSDYDLGPQQVRADTFEGDFFLYGTTRIKGNPDRGTMVVIKYDTTATNQVWTTELQGFQHPFQFLVFDELGGMYFALRGKKQGGDPADTATLSKLSTETGEVLLSVVFATPFIDEIKIYFDPWLLTPQIDVRGIYHNSLYYSFSLSGELLYDYSASE